MTQTHKNRLAMHCPSFKEGMAESDQSKGITPPVFAKPRGGNNIVLPTFEGMTASAPGSLYENLLDIRRSLRSYADTPMTGAQLAFMLWSVQGIQTLRGEVATFRPVPSGGARHPFETYIAVKSVEGIEPGLYHYLPTENIGEKLCTIEHIGPRPDNITEMLVGQSWADKAPAVIFYTCIPYRAEWRYADMSHRVMLIDLGHAGQNAMLSAAALGLGSCCMAAYDQKLCDEALGVDGLEEYVVYAVAVGSAERSNSIL